MRFSLQKCYCFELKLLECITGCPNFAREWSNPVFNNAKGKNPKFEIQRGNWTKTVTCIHLQVHFLNSTNIWVHFCFDQTKVQVQPNNPYWSNLRLRVYFFTKTHSNSIGEVSKAQLLQCWTDWKHGENSFTPRLASVPIFRGNQQPLLRQKCVWKQEVTFFPIGRWTL